MPFMALNQKAISAITSGDVPDLIFHDAPATLLPQNAWDDKLEDVSDVVEAHRTKFSETALLNSTFYNGTTKRRSFYLVPIKQAVAPFHIWGDLVAKAGFQTIRRAEDVGRILGFLQACARRNCAPRECARFTGWGCRSPPSDRTTATVCSRIS